MLGHFPTPHPDELLYSVCARYSDRVRYPNKKAIPQDIFGTINATAVIDFPSRLGSLVDRLPPNSPYTVDRLIDEHTLLPFFAAFLPYERARLLREDMTDSNGSAIHMRSGVMVGRIPFRRRLRYCLLCAADDKKRVGETYWHRLHQLPGVEVCPDHAVLLEESDALVRHSKNSFQFLLAGPFIQASVARPLNLSDPTHKVLLKIALDAEWLLGQRGLTSNLEALRNRYIILLIERGLASYSGCVRARDLFDRFKEQYSPSLLKHLHCEFTGGDLEKDNWLLHLVRRPKHVHQPLRHLLLLNFFGISAEEFFALPEEIKFFGDPPWPCLNTAASHYREACITDCQISFRGPNHRPVGTFQCGCGFAYARTGPDLLPEDRFRISKMKSFGPVWEEALVKLWGDSKLSVSEVARRLEVDPLTVRRHATRLGLSFLRGGRRGITSLGSDRRLKSRANNDEDRKRKDNRRKWLRALTRTRRIRLKVLRRRMPRVYAWLLRNDKAWLKTHKPQPLKQARSTSSVDWNRRDLKLAVAVRSTALSLLNASGKPILVSMSAIGKSLGLTTLLQQKINKLPMTAQALEEVAESGEDFATRRVWWAVRCYLQEDIVPRRWQLILRSNVYRWMKDPQVKGALNAAMETLELEESYTVVASAV